MTTAMQPGGSGSEGGRHLRRDVGMIGLLFAGVGSIIGSGWLLGAFNASKIAGPAAVFSWLIAGVMIILIGLTYAELGTMFPVSAGVIRFPHYAFGPFASYMMGWINWFAAAVVAPVEVEAVLQYATYYLPFLTNKDTTLSLPWGYLIAVLLLALFCVVNVLGVRHFARLNNVLVWWKIVVIVLVVIALFVLAFTVTGGNASGGADNFSSHSFAPTGLGGIFSAIATAGITFSYLGFRQGIELAGETDNPHRNVPVAVIGSVAISATIYIALQLAFTFALPASVVDKTNGWLGLAFNGDSSPLAGVALLLGAGWLAKLLFFDAVISPGDTGLIYTTITSRLGYAMGRNGNAPAGVAKLNRNGVPWVATLITFVLGLVIFLPFPSWQKLVSLVTSATVLSFGSGPLAYAALRRSLPDQPRPFRLPGRDVIAFLAFFSSNMIIFWTGWTTNWKFFVAVLIGLALLGVFKATRQVTAPNFEWRAGAWILPWLGGLAVISFLGNGEEENGGINLLGTLPGIVVTLIWSAIIYAFAVKVRLTGDKVRAIIAKTPHDEVAVEEPKIGRY
ncbi:MAG: APC family permease [Actinocatenispora sp.]